MGLLTGALQYLEENVKAVNVKLTQEELQEVRDVAKKADATLGERYPVAAMALMFGDTPELKWWQSRQCVAGSRN